MNPLCKINVKCIMYHLIFRGSRFLAILIFFRNFSVFIFSPASAKTFTIRYHLRGSSYNYSDILHFCSEDEEKKKKGKEGKPRELSMFATSGIASNLTTDLENSIFCFQFPAARLR